MEKYQFVAIILFATSFLSAQNYGTWEYEDSATLKQQEDSLQYVVSSLVANGRQGPVISAWFDLLEWARYKQFCYSDTITNEYEVYVSASGKELITTGKSFDPGFDQYWTNGEQYIWQGPRQVIERRIPECTDFMQWKLKRALDFFANPENSQSYNLKPPTFDH